MSRDGAYEVRRYFDMNCMVFMYCIHRRDEHGEYGVRSNDDLGFASAAAAEAYAVKHYGEQEVRSE